MLVEEGDALNPIRFKAIPLPQVTLDAGHNDTIDHVYRMRRIKMRDLQYAYPKGTMSDKMMMDMEKGGDKECEILEVVYRNYL